MTIQSSEHSSPLPPGTKTSVRYLDVDVLTMAKQRIRHVLATFDKLYVSFSGGKDSLAVLHLVMEVYDELGITEPVNVVFRDEELIPDDVIQFVQDYYHHPRINMQYIAVPLASSKFILGRTYDYVQWDPARDWLRPKPPYAITDAGQGSKVCSQYDLDRFLFANVRGKVACLTGVRADESLVRFRSCVNKKNENYINATEVANVKLVKPIYDWSENDIFKYFYDRQIKYCAIYDAQLWNKQSLRVSTPLHAESAKEFGKIRTVYPLFYQQLVNLFPEMLVQERYWKAFDRYGIIYRYPRSWDGVMQYIHEHIDDPHQRALAKQRVNMARTIRENNQRTGKAGRPENYWGYPILYVFKTIVAGSYKRVIQPCKDPTKEEWAYEQPAAQ